MAVVCHTVSGKDIMRMSDFIIDGSSGYSETIYKFEPGDLVITSGLWYKSNHVIQPGTPVVILKRRPGGSRWSYTGGYSNCYLIMVGNETYWLPEHCLTEA
jgi:hypothetical protein